MRTAKPDKGLGSEQALAPVREPDTFAEGAWDKLTKTEGTFETRISRDSSLKKNLTSNYHEQKLKIKSGQGNLMHIFAPQKVFVCLETKELVLSDRN